MNKIKAALVAATIALSGLGIAAAPAQADTCKLMGKAYNCGYTVTSEPLPNGTEQVFVIGTDRAVWTNWSLPDGSWYGWESMGGVAQSGISIWDVSDGGWVFSIVITGTDGNPWHRTRSAGGTWSPWSLPTCPEPDYNASC
ncbi:hypothetical protein [Streptomyces murinus]|uniref:hypothetical protein n=1 Tax=Streptomyces murinus TaxID=33900 RepID=UPI00381D1149